MSDRISLVRWRDAKADPPKGDPHRRLFAFTRHGEPCLPEAGAVARQPDEYTVWCDPSPPDGDDPLGPLTHSDLLDAWTCLAWMLAQEDPDVVNLDGGSAARLRRAIEEAER